MNVVPGSLPHFLRRSGARKNRMERTVQYPVPAEFDTKAASHQVVGAVASSQIFRLNALATAALKINDICGHAFVERFERFEPRAVTRAVCQEASP